jgi:membrane-associated phospholipid phosphatase
MRSSRRGRWHLWLLAALAVAFFAGFLWIARGVRDGSSLAAWDSHLTHELVEARNPRWDRVLWCFTLVGNTPVMSALASSAVLLLAVWGRLSRAILMAGALASAQGVSSAAKALAHHARPPQALALIKLPGSFSLPSGHAFLTLLFLGLLVFLLFRGIGLGGPRARGAGRLRPWLLLGVTTIVAATIEAFVGLSRVYLGVHWASDVLAGWFIGGAWLALSFGTFLAWERGPRPLGDRRPWGSRASRVALAVALGLIVAVTVVLAAWADPLLV